MPIYTIETTYHLPVYRQRTYNADTIADACRKAIEDDGWDDAKEDVDTSGETYVSGIWQGADAAYSGPAILIPSQFAETVERKAGHFEILLGLLKLLLADVQAARPSSHEWIARARWAVARGEAIIAGARDPDAPVEGDRP